MFALSPWLFFKRLRSRAAPSSVVDFTVCNWALLELPTRPVSLIPEGIDEFVGPAL